MVLGKIKKSIKSVNLLDGQSRGEVIFRRVSVVIIGYLLIVLMGNVLINKEQVVDQVEARTPVVEVKTGDIYNGQEVEIDENGKVWYLQDYTPTPEPEVEDKVSSFIKSYGGRIDSEYLGYLRLYCNQEALETVVAISVAETSMGKNTTRNTNFYGWFKGGNRNYDPSKEEMAQEICTGIERSYIGIGSNDKVASKYTGGDSTSNWMKNYNWARSQMR